MPLIWGFEQWHSPRQIGTTGKSRMARMRILPAGQFKAGGGIAGAQSETIQWPLSVMPAPSTSLSGAKESKDVDHRDKRVMTAVIHTGWIAALAMTVFSKRTKPIAGLTTN